MDRSTDTTAAIVIVGGGAAGLSTAGALKRRGYAAVVLERDGIIGGTWARRYDRLHLHTARPWSGLAHYPIPRSYPRYPSKDQFARYLQEYAAHFRLNVRTGCPVTRVAPAEHTPRPRWQVESACGTWRPLVVVLATGHYDVPQQPAWPGQDTYTGRLIHSAEYRTGRDYAGRRVLVIGIGNSGAEVAADLAEQGAACVAISVRTPPFIVPRDRFGLPIQLTGLLMSRLPLPPGVLDRISRSVARQALGDLRPYGLGPATRFPYTHQQVPCIDVGFVRELKAGRVAVRPNVAAFTPGGVVYVDGQEEAFDAVIAATGFRTALPGLLDVPGALDAHGMPRAVSGGATRYPGLYFMGYFTSVRGHLYETNRASRALAARIARYLERVTPRAAVARPTPVRPNKDL
jgi:cation diffusion facilitator CzcD-associated flavoprotein CzcO